MRFNAAAVTAAAVFTVCPGVLAAPNGEFYPGLHARAECKPYKIQGGDSCSVIAKDRCNNIKLDDLYKYNSGLKDKCNNLKVGTYVCCTSGDMPDMDPPSYSNGSCHWLQAKQGDTCYSIAKDRCPGGIELEQFYKFNPNSTKWCNTMGEGKAVCCSKGKLPDLKPKKNADGSCKWAEVAPGGGCIALAGANFLEVEDLAALNEGKTWGWQGCERLKPYQRVCVSEGTPPMPAQYDDITCGPQKRGTQPSTNGTKVTDLNPCPLNVCCNTHGYCGTTPDFCTESFVKDTPGTNKNGTNGCISNCGLEIKKGSSSSFGKIGYFESWNPYTRPCLNMDINDVEKLNAGYTHIHFAFANLTTDFKPDISGVQDQWDKFVKLKNVKRIVAFGGWAFSNEANTGFIIRNGVRSNNRAAFAKNVVDFVNKHGIDGVDFDWEYPGADDIDENPDKGTPEDGINYQKFMALVKSGLGSGKTVSFAAPASYWYLKNFPIASMAKQVDYIVYMTYDLHGQWDVGNKWAVDGCEGGNCLRSHVNRTETMYSLAMITKAGVPTDKIFVGVSSYGRSFKMAKKGCKGPMCKFLGARNQSPAAPGACTGTGGYISDAEIRQTKSIIAQGLNDMTYESTYDEDSDSDIFVYNGDEWVAWMDTETKERRIAEYKSLGFAGTSDWAIDLQKEFGFTKHLGKGNGTFNGELEFDAPDCMLGKDYKDLDTISSNSDNQAPACLAMKSIEVLKSMLDDSFNGYDDAASGYDGLFPVYEEYIKDTLPQQLVQWLWNDDPKKAGVTYMKCYADRGTIYSKWENAKEYPCKDLPNKKAGDDYTIWLKVQDQKKLEASMSAAGIDPEWVESYKSESTDGVDNCPITEGTTTCITTNTWIYDNLRIKKNIEIPDPKDAIIAAKNNITNIKDEFDETYNKIGMGEWHGSPADAVEVLAMPVMMLRDAVESMKEVKELAKKINKENKKNLILKIIEAVLFVIPFIGGLVGGLGRIGAALARFLSVAEIAGSSGVAIYSMVEDPAMAPVAIMGMLLGALGAPRTSMYKTTAKAKRDMTPDMKKNMGKHFTEINPKVEGITGKMCGRK